MTRERGEDLLFPRPAPFFIRANAAPPRPLAWLIAWGVMLLALLAPALWNGFPLIFADTGGYLARPFEGTLALGRSALYGAFVASGIALSFFLVVLVQSVLAVWVILLVLRAQGVGGRPWLASVLVVALAALTSLPWYASQLMPDIFVPLAVLALYLLAFCRETQNGVERAGLALLVAFAVASHMATLALCVALVICFAALWPFARRLRFPPVRLGWPAAAVAGGILLALASNAAIGGRLAFTPGGASFVFGRLVQDGIVARYLAERCPDPEIRLCAYASELPKTADDWMWGWDTPFWKLGGYENYDAEERRIIAETLRLYPGQHLATAVMSALQQLVMAKSGEGLTPETTDNNKYAIATFERLAPASVADLVSARQQRREIDVEPFNVVHVPVALLATFLLPLLALAPRRYVGAPAAALAAAALLALLANAAIAGALSNPNHRYQSRIVWIAPFAVALAVLSRRTMRRDQPF